MTVVRRVSREGSERWRILAALCGALATALFLAGGQCGPAPVDRCSSDEQCGEFRRCEVETGICLCVDERGCSGTNEVCNALGRCQPLSGCSSNAECCQGDVACAQFCDVKTSQCLSVDECQPDEGETCCTLDSHCPYGQICNALDQRCIPGCRDDGDCLLGQGCVGAGLGGRIGQCAADLCTANNLCDFGEICNLETSACVFDTRGPYCAGCSGGVGSDDCGEPANYCLLDTSDPTGQAEYCGVDCSQNQPCPFGYECHEVIILPPSLPACSAPEVCVKAQPEDASGHCSRSAGLSCAVDEDCPEGPPGSDCPRADVGNCLLDQTEECQLDTDCCEDASACPAGSCIKQECVGGEGAAYGVCTCTRDLDCPRDQCMGADLSDPENPVLGHCELSGHRCYDDIDCDVIVCVDGGCRIGANCAPANDRTCAELTQAGQR